MTKIGLIALFAAFAATPATGNASSFTGANWQPTALASASPTAKQQIIFDANGRVYGSDGCNRFSGHYKLDASGAVSVDTRNMIATKMGCRDAEVRQSSAAFMTALTDMRNYQIEGDSLILLDLQGNRLAQLAR